jgi:hypothetical protein
MVNNYLIKLLKFHNLVICMPEIEFIIGLGIYEGFGCLGSIHLLGHVIFNHVQALFFVCLFFFKFFFVHMPLALFSCIIEFHFSVMENVCAMFLLPTNFFCVFLLLQIACRDYPHPRHLCAKHPFSSTPHDRHCDQVRSIFKLWHLENLALVLSYVYVLPFSFLAILKCSATVTSVNLLRHVYIGALASPVLTIVMPLIKRSFGKFRGKVSSWRKKLHYEL